jgi:ABC-type multidrug transport system fused ATPase/permease subunit
LHQLSHGLDTLLTEQGGNISVGEAQRISFARAYLKNCPILLMDEATSALDSENEALIKNAFEQLAREKTVLVIAHRLDTVKQADQIYVLEAGSVAESGTHQELLGAKGLYHGLISTWNS